MSKANKNKTEDREEALIAKTIEKLMKNKEFMQSIVDTVSSMVRKSLKRKPRC